MPSLTDHILLGMDFCAVRCGNAALVLETVWSTAAEPAEPAARAGESPKGVPPGGERRPPRRVRRHDRKTPGSSLRPTFVQDGAAQPRSRGEWPEDLEPELKGLLEAELALFEGPQGVSHIAEHKIRLKDYKPLKKRYYPKNPAMQGVVDEHMNELIHAGATKEQHVAWEAFRRLRAANLKLNRKKCRFIRKRLVYLGHVISGEGICTDPEKVEAIQSLRAPANWLRRFVPNFAILVPMTELLKKGRK
ncbi:hypothetical protein ACLKA7_001485 [Drosophila subpalustris]